MAYPLQNHIPDDSGQSLRPFPDRSDLWLLFVGHSLSAKARLKLNLSLSPCLCLSFDARQSLFLAGALVLCAVAQIKNPFSLVTGGCGVLELGPRSGRGCLPLASSSA